MATATDTDGIDVDDSDPSAYFGIATGIVVKKFTNGADADTPFGPGSRSGTPSLDLHRRPRAGSTVPLENIVLWDDAGTPATPPV